MNNYNSRLQLRFRDIVLRKSSIPSSNLGSEGFIFKDDDIVRHLKPINVSMQVGVHTMKPSNGVIDGTMSDIEERSPDYSLHETDISPRSWSRKEDTQDSRAPDTLTQSLNYVTPALKEIELLTLSWEESIKPGWQQAEASGAMVTDTAFINSISPSTTERWIMAYKAMTYEAETLGIPGYAIPKLADSPTTQQIREARDLLQGMIASFLSAGL